MRVVAISGVKNSGKTTFLEHLIPCLRRRGLQVAVIKHDGHEFEPDVPGTDSDRLRKAGAQGVAVYSAGRWMMIREEACCLEDLLPQFAAYDLILLEGHKESAYPKIELVRSEVSKKGVCDPATLLALATDTDCRIEGIETIALTDYEKAADILIEKIIA